MENKMEGPSPLRFTRAILPAVSWSAFFEAVKEALTLKLASYSPPGQKDPVFVREYPKNNLGKFDSSFDVILYKVISAERAGTRPNGVDRKPNGPTLKESIPHPTKARYHLNTYGWDENMEVQFIILTKSNDRADELIEWFHRFMIEYTWALGFFKARGINYLVYQKRGEDKLNKEYDQELYERTENYIVRLQLLYSFDVKDLESLNVTIQGNPEQEIDLEERYIIPS